VAFSSFDAAVAVCASLPTDVCVAVVGSRDFSALELVRSFVASLPAGVVIVSGGARGVDQCAEQSARARGLTVVSLPFASQFGRAGGPIRNKQLVASLPSGSVLVAFRCHGDSPGTDNVISLARAADGVRVFVVASPPPASPSQLSLF
jgi:DNA recombination-mediator protein A